MGDWVIPALTLAAGLAGGYAGARGAVVRLETQMLDMRKRMETAEGRIHRHGSDLLVHDMEIELALTKLEIPRVRRQKVQE